MADIKLPLPAYQPPPPPEPTGAQLVAQLLIPIEDILQILQTQVERLHRSTMATWAHVGRGGPGARRYSRTKLRDEAEQLRGMFSLVYELILARVPGGEIPTELRQLVWKRSGEAYNVVEGRNPDGTEITKKPS